MYKVIFFDLGDTLVDSSKGWLPGAAELLQQLHQSKIRLGIISNTGEMSREELAGLLPADFSWTIFEDKLVILSSEVKIEKPSLDIFRLAASRSGAASHTCLFCSENPLDCLAAQQAGLHACRVQKPPNSDVAEIFSILEQLSQIHDK